LTVDDNVLLLRVPWIIRPGERLEIGEVVVERGENGDVRACDRYGCAEARVPPEREVGAAPIPALYRVLTATPFLYVEFEKRIYIESGEDYWTLAPYEVEVYVGRLALIRLSPVKVKYTLIGDVVDGVLARHHRSPVAFDQEELPDPLGTAVVRFRVKGSSILLPGIGFNAIVSKFFVDEKGTIYYPLLEVETDGSLVTVKNTGQPPKPGLREISRVGIARRVPLTSLFQQVQPFTMTVQVVRRALTSP